MQSWSAQRLSRVVAKVQLGSPGFAMTRVIALKLLCQVRGLKSRGEGKGQQIFHEQKVCHALRDENK